MWKIGFVWFCYTEECALAIKVYFFQMKAKQGILSSNVKKSKVHFYRSIYQKRRGCKERVFGKNLLDTICECSCPWTKPGMSLTEQRLSFCTASRLSQSIDPRVFPGSTAMPQRQPLPGDYSGAVYIQRLTTTEVMVVFGCSKRWKDGWGIFSDGRWFVILLEGSFPYPLRIWL